MAHIPDLIDFSGNNSIPSFDPFGDLGSFNEYIAPLEENSENEKKIEETSNKKTDKYVTKFEKILGNTENGNIINPNEYLIEKTNKIHNFYPINVADFDKKTYKEPLQTYYSVPIHSSHGNVKKADPKNIKNPNEVVSELYKIIELCFKINNLNSWEGIIIAGGSITDLILGREKSDIADLDIYIVAKDDNEFYEKINFIISNSKMPKKGCKNKYVTVSKYCISFNAGDYRIQIIRDRYNKSDETIKYFDLVACRIYFDIYHGALMADPDYVNYVMNHRIEIIKKEAISSTYELRLLKYYKKGLSLVLNFNLENMSFDKKRHDSLGLLINGPKNTKRKTYGYGGETFYFNDTKSDELKDPYYGNNQHKNEEFDPREYCSFIIDIIINKKKQVPWFVISDYEPLKFKNCLVNNEFYMAGICKNHLEQTLINKLENEQLKVANTVIGNLPGINAKVWANKKELTKIVKEKLDNIPGYSKPVKMINTEGLEPGEAMRNNAIDIMTNDQKENWYCMM